MQDCQDAVESIQVKNDGGRTEVIGNGEKRMDSGCILEE